MPKLESCALCDKELISDMKKSLLDIRIFTYIAWIFFVGVSSISAETDDPLLTLVQLISFEAEAPALDITQASVSNCTLTVETLRRAPDPDRTIISTSTTVALHALYGNNSLFFLTPGREDDGARWSIFVTEDTATATYRLDQPSRNFRLGFRDRFDQQCRSELCQVDFTPTQLSIHIQPSSPAERTELTNAFRDAINYCHRLAN
ncbi:MAG: hypothetical protein AAFR10_13490 [Pseudomonadota bacterium]